MTTSTDRPRRRGAATLVVVAVAAVIALAAAGPAAAHASLVSTDPAEGAVLDTAPEQVVLTFNEPIVSVPDGVTVFAATGDEIDSTATARDSDLVVSLDGDLGQGTTVVVWRVVSADGHPIAGSLTFSVGAPSQVVVTPAGAGPATGEVPLALSVVRWVGYVGLLVAVGLVWFAALLVRPRDDVLPRVRRVAAVAAGVATTAWLVGLPLTGAYQRGVGLSAALDNATWRTLPGEEYLIALLVAAGTLNAVVLRGYAAATAALVAVAAPALTGHTRAAEPVALSVAADALHLVAGAVWLGGLVGLALTLPRLAGPPATALVSRFSTLAAGVLVALVASGSLMAWRIVGSWDALVSTGYGRLLLVKIGVALVAVAIAAVNRFVLLPRGGQAKGTISRAVTAEAAVLVAVLLVTGFLVNKSPEGSAPATAPAGGSTVERAALGDLVVLGTLTPGRSGENTLTLQVQDAAGEPAEGRQAPTVRLSTDGLDLGTVPLTPSAAGTYEADVVLPRAGTWEVQVSLRLDEFENPVGRLTFEVG